jgi:hypothetical protein
MNRYLVRSLVAILTFSIGVAVGSIFRPSVQPSYRQFRHTRCRDSAPPPQAYLRAEQYPSPSVAIDNASTDPVKLRYSHSRLIPGSSRQLVQFTLEPNTTREVLMFTINYQSRWSSANQSGRGAVPFTKSIKTASYGLMSSAANVAIECDSDETLSVWIESVQFNDGSRWQNPRHPFN